VRGIIVGAVAGMLGIAVPAGAQRAADRHEGFWIGAGLGGGWNTDRGTDGETLGGGAVYIRLGGSPSPKLLIGGEAIGWGRELNNTTLSRGNATFSLMFYPGRNGGLFLKGGVGAATVDQSVTVGRVTTTLRGSGFGSTVGLGWDLKVGRNLYLTPNLDFLYQSVDGGSNTLTLLTFGATWH